MRNCFVPHCDAFCKKNGIIKRMMFSSPKDNFTNWKNILFNKREFRETDRVCERHFDRSQILTHWEHIIDGKLCQLEREKPKIRSDAVPYLNLPEADDLVFTVNKRRASKKKPEQKMSKSAPGFAKKCCGYPKQMKYKEYDNYEAITTIDVDDGENHKKPKPASPTKTTKNSCEIFKAELLSDEEKLENKLEEKRKIFNMVYDDIPDVELPNTLWGVHRDPEDRRYIAFTMFDAQEMRCSVAVKISDTFELNVFANGVRKPSDTLNELSLDSIAKLLRQFSESVNP